MVDQCLISMVRFDKPCVHVSHAANYFSIHMAKQDYLSQGGAVTMTWVGKGAERLHLPETVIENDFVQLCRGYDPTTGKRLMVRDKGIQRRVCYFGQISPPKDVSVTYLVGGDERIEKWWQESVKETLAEIEAVTATRVRRGRADEDRMTGEMIAAVVSHDTSRSLDPQLHTHLCIMNTTYDAAEKRWKSIQPSAYYRYESFFREVCYNKLAERLVEAGYKLEPSRPIGFTIQGFPDECRKIFSKRRQEIERVADALKTRNQDALQAIAAQTRSAKRHVEGEKLKAFWREECGEHLPEIRKAIRAADGVKRVSPNVQASTALSAGMEHCFERNSVMDERLLLREALISGRGEVSLADLRLQLQRQVDAGTLVRHENLIASKQMRDMETACITWARQRQEQYAPFGKATALDPGLRDEQRTAVKAILGSRARLVILQGDAGTGKTTSLKEIVRGIEEQGGLVFACAPSSGATEVLRQELSAQADTLQQLLVNEALQRRVKGQTLIVDEAGLISIRQMHDLFVLAHQQHCRLILVGDIKQHASVEAGDALRALQNHALVPVVGLKQIRRQQNPEYREVVAWLAKGEPYHAFAELDRLGAVQEEKDFSKMLDQAADTYVSRLKAGESCLAISPVWSEVHALTRKVRGRLKETRTLHGEEVSFSTVQSLQWTETEKRRVKHYQSGDVIVFHRAIDSFTKHEAVKVIAKADDHLLVERTNGSRTSFFPATGKSFDVGISGQLELMAGEHLLIRANCAEAKVRNGDIVEVAGWDESGVIRLKDGRQLPAYFRQFTYGYASTSHAAQGKTVDHGLLILGEEGMKAADLKQAYVSNSRFRQSQSIFTTDKMAAYAAMASPADRMLATELPVGTPEKLSPTPTEEPEINLWFQRSPGQRAGIKV
jgi:conjugative relaxase-like TrwC/TraI family protein